MPDLIAQGPSSHDRWRREMPDPSLGRVIRLGRSGADWNVPWDSMISRHHVNLNTLLDDRLEVQRIPNARNGVYYGGNQVSVFRMVPGEHFVIGKTTFTLVNRPGASITAGNSQVAEHAYDQAVLRRRHFRDAASRIEMLSRLPDLIASSVSDEELLVRVTGVLLQATPDATAVAVVAATTSDQEPLGHDHVDNETLDSISDANDDAPPRPVRVLHYDHRAAQMQGPSISARLVRNAIEKRDSILHLWSGSPQASEAFTASEEADWAFCVPLRSEACPGWALYVTGNLSSDTPQEIHQSIQAAPENLQDDVKFAELVGSTIASLQQNRRLHRRQTEMRHFFAPVVLEALASQNVDEVLAPQEADLSIMFCDLRGFSRRSEQDASNLLELLSHVSDALGVMTKHILDCRGVIGDFHGDAAMGFWGWPLEQEDAVGRAVQAAVRIRQDYQTSGNVSGFRCGIGIATGRAVAGRIGTSDQVKVTAFGPVVNLASRLEGLTKTFGVEVLIDQTTRDQLRAIPEHGFRVRRLGKLIPPGFRNSVVIHELVSGDLSDQQVTSFELAVECFENGQWRDAHSELESLPLSDPPTQRLRSIIREHQYQPPPSWNGTVIVDSTPSS